MQVSKAAWVLGKYYDEHKSNYGYDVGRTTVTQDGVAVTPANRATADLFIYNPVAGVEKGNGQLRLSPIANFRFASARNLFDHLSPILRSPPRK